MRHTRKFTHASSHWVTRHTDRLVRRSERVPRPPVGELTSLPCQKMPPATARTNRIPAIQRAAGRMHVAMATATRRCEKDESRGSFSAHTYMLCHIDATDWEETANAKQRAVSPSRQHFATTECTNACGTVSNACVAIIGRRRDRAQWRVTPTRVATHGGRLRRADEGNRRWGHLARGPQTLRGFCGVARGARGRSPSARMACLRTNVS